MSTLQDKVALITGAAGGIGRAAAEALVEAGARVLLIDRDATGLAQAAGGLPPERAATRAADLTQDGEVEACTRYCQECFGRLDIAVLNAGVTGANCPIEDYPVELFDAVMALNLRAAWLGLRAAIPLMKAQGGGSVIVTSSIQGLAALPGTTAYTVSKHALVGMVKGASLELAPFGIRVNAVHPGYVRTPMMERIHQEVSPGRPADFEAALAGTVPMGRYAEAAEIARLIRFLASDEASYSTGGSFSADGGLLAALPFLKQ